jgi:hypothetical protein
MRKRDARWVFHPHTPDKYAFLLDCISLASRQTPLLYKGESSSLCSGFLINTDSTHQAAAECVSFLQSAREL